MPGKIEVKRNGRSRQSVNTIMIVLQFTLVFD